MWCIAASDDETSGAPVRPEPAVPPPQQALAARHNKRSAVKVALPSSSSSEHQQGATTTGRPRKSPLSHSAGIHTALSAFVVPPLQEGGGAAMVAVEMRFFTTSDRTPLVHAAVSPRHSMRVASAKARDPTAMGTLSVCGLREDGSPTGAALTFPVPWGRRRHSLSDQDDGAAAAAASDDALPEGTRVVHFALHELAETFCAQSNSTGEENALVNTVAAEFSFSLRDAAVDNGFRDTQSKCSVTLGSSGSRSGAMPPRRLAVPNDDVVVEVYAEGGSRLLRGEQAGVCIRARHRDTGAPVHVRGTVQPDEISSPLNHTHAEDDGAAAPANADRAQIGEGAFTPGKAGSRPEAQQRPSGTTGESNLELSFTHAGSVASTLRVSERRSQSGQNRSARTFATCPFTGLARVTLPIPQFGAFGLSLRRPRVTDREGGSSVMDEAPRPIRADALNIGSAGVQVSFDSRLVVLSSGASLPAVEETTDDAASRSNSRSQIALTTTAASPRDRKSVAGNNEDGGKRGQPTALTPRLGGTPGGTSPSAGPSPLASRRSGDVRLHLMRSTTSAAALGVPTGSGKGTNTKATVVAHLVRPNTCRVINTVTTEMEPGQKQDITLSTTTTTTMTVEGPLWWGDATAPAEILAVLVFIVAPTPAGNVTPFLVAAAPILALHGGGYAAAGVDASGCTESFARRLRAVCGAAASSAVTNGVEPAGDRPRSAVEAPGKTKDGPPALLPMGVFDASRPNRLGPSSLPEPELAQVLGVEQAASSAVLLLFECCRGARDFLPPALRRWATQLTAASHAPTAVVPKPPASPPPVEVSPRSPSQRFDTKGQSFGPPPPPPPPPPPVQGAGKSARANPRAAAVAKPHRGGPGRGLHARIRLLAAVTAHSDLSETRQSDRKRFPTFAVSSFAVPAGALPSPTTGESSPTTSARPFPDIPASVTALSSSGTNARPVDRFEALADALATPIRMLSSSSAASSPHHLSTDETRQRQREAAACSFLAGARQHGLKWVGRDSIVHLIVRHSPTPVATLRALDRDNRAREEWFSRDLLQSPQQPGASLFGRAPGAVAAETPAQLALGIGRLDAACWIARRIVGAERTEESRARRRAAILATDDGLGITVLATLLTTYAARPHLIARFLSAIGVPSDGAFDVWRYRVPGEAASSAPLSPVTATPSPRAEAADMALNADVFSAAVTAASVACGSIQPVLAPRSVVRRVLESFGVPPAATPRSWAEWIRCAAAAVDRASHGLDSAYGGAMGSAASAGAQATITPQAPSAPPPEAGRASPRPGARMSVSDAPPVQHAKSASSLLELSSAARSPLSVSRRMTVTEVLKSSFEHALCSRGRIVRRLSHTDHAGIAKAAAKADADAAAVDSGALVEALRPGLVAVSTRTGVIWGGATTVPAPYHGVVVARPSGPSDESAGHDAVLQLPLADPLHSALDRDACSDGPVWASLQPFDHASGPSSALPTLSLSLSPAALGLRVGTHVYIGGPACFRQREATVADVLGAEHDTHGRDAPSEMIAAPASPKVTLVVRVRRADAKPGAWIRDPVAEAETLPETVAAIDPARHVVSAVLEQFDSEIRSACAASSTPVSDAEVPAPLRVVDAALTVAGADEATDGSPSPTKDHAVPPFMSVAAAAALYIGAGHEVRVSVAVTVAPAPSWEPAPAIAGPDGLEMTAATANSRNPGPPATVPRHPFVPHPSAESSSGMAAVLRSRELTPQYHEAWPLPGDCTHHHAHSTAPTRAAAPSSNRLAINVLMRFGMPKGPGQQPRVAQPQAAIDTTTAVLARLAAAAQLALKAELEELGQPDTPTRQLPSGATGKIFASVAAACALVTAPTSPGNSVYAGTRAASIDSLIGQLARTERSTVASASFASALDTSQRMETSLNGSSTPAAKGSGGGLLDSPRHHVDAKNNPPDDETENADRIGVDLRALGLAAYKGLCRLSPDAPVPSAAFAVKATQHTLLCRSAAGAHHALDGALDAAAADWSPDAPWSLLGTWVAAECGLWRPAFPAPATTDSDSADAVADALKVIIAARTATADAATTAKAWRRCELRTQLAAGTALSTSATAIGVIAAAAAADESTVTTHVARLHSVIASGANDGNASASVSIAAPPILLWLCALALDRSSNVVQTTAPSGPEGIPPAMLSGVSPPATLTHAVNTSDLRDAIHDAEHARKVIAESSSGSATENALGAAAHDATRGLHWAICRIRSDEARQMAPALANAVATSSSPGVDRSVVVVEITDFPGPFVASAVPAAATGGVDVLIGWPAAADLTKSSHVKIRLTRPAAKA